MTSYQEMVTSTLEAFKVPQVGDRFHEMYSFWLYVVEVNDDGSIVTAQGLSFPYEAKFLSYENADAFRAKWSDSSGPVVLLASRGEDVTGWREAAREVTPVSAEKRAARW